MGYPLHVLAKTGGLRGGGHGNAHHRLRDGCPVSSLAGHLYYYFNHLNFINLIILTKYHRYTGISEGKAY
jgi:hypothetical protein